MDDLRFPREILFTENTVPKTIFQDWESRFNKSFRKVYKTENLSYKLSYCPSNIQYVRIVVVIL